MLWFAGLRGAMAFALSLDIPGPNGRMMMTTVLVTCIFTVRWSQVSIGIVEIAPNRFCRYCIDLFGF
jgi:hypothetical protein